MSPRASAAWSLLRVFFKLNLDEPVLYLNKLPVPLLLWYIRTEVPLSKAFNPATFSRWPERPDGGWV